MSAQVAVGLAAITDGNGGFVIEETAVRAPLEGEVRVRLGAAGICHTDHASLSWEGPLVMGHEGAGVVESVGSGTRVVPGQGVLLNWAIPCGTCPQCLRQCGSLCERTHGIDPGRLGSSRAHSGHTLWRDRAIERSFNLGTFAEFTLVREEALTPLPAAIPMRSACILGCAVMTGVGSVLNCAKLQQGESVAIVGCGGVGLSVVQGARLGGAARIIAIDQRTVSFERAVALGATDTIQIAADDVDNERMVAEVFRLSGGRGVDYAFEATGQWPLAFLPLQLIRNGGTAVQVSGAHGRVSVSMPSFMWDKKYVAPLYGGCHPERDFPRLFDWVERGALKLDGLISRTYGLNQVGAAIADMLSGKSAKGVLLFE